MFEIHDDAHPGDPFRVAAADKEAAQELYIEWREACQQVHGNLNISRIPNGWDKV